MVIKVIKLPCKFCGYKLMQVNVRDNNIEQAIKALKKKLQRENVFREMRLRTAYEKKTSKRIRKKAEAIRRTKKLERKRIEKQGF